MNSPTKPAQDELGFHIEQRGLYRILVEHDGGCYPARPTECALWDALQAARAQEAPALPPGWKAVPIEPTPEMAQAGYEAIFVDVKRSDGMKSARKWYRAVLAASPPLPAAPAEDQPWRTLYRTVNAMMVCIGAHGEISARDDRACAVMDALAAIDGGTVDLAIAAAPEEPT